MSEEFYPEHEIHTDPVENQQTEQQTWQAAQQQTAQQTWQAAPQQPSSPAPEAKKKGGKAAKVVALLLACALVGGGSGFGARLQFRLLRFVRRFRHARGPAPDRSPAGRVHRHQQGADAE